MKYTIEINGIFTTQQFKENISKIWESIQECEQFAYPNIENIPKHLVNRFYPWLNPCWSVTSGNDYYVSFSRLNRNLQKIKLREELEILFKFIELPKSRQHDDLIDDYEWIVKNLKKHNPDSKIADRCIEIAKSLIEEI